MSAVKTTHDAIEEFVEAIAEQYLSASSVGDAQQMSSPDDFVSAIELDVRSTLRERLSMLDTVREIEQSPTAEMSASDVADDIEATMDTSQSVDLEATTNLDLRGDTAVDSPRPSRVEIRPGSSSAHVASKGDAHSSQQSAASEQAASFDVESASADMPTMDSSASSHGGASVRPGKSAASEFSYDDVTMDSEAAKPVSSVHSGKKKSKLPPADVPSDYEVISLLGKGGMGVVYKAKHIPLNRLVAVKMIITGANASEEQLTRFQREAEAAAHLSHPNIVSVYEVGKHNGLPYFSLEFVEGQSLSDLMRQQTLSPQRAAELLIPIARAVHYSHQQGILHRDLKPQNILLTEDGTPKVADFGLAKRLDEDGDDEMTREGVIVGTPGYMAPEQARTDTVGPQTDVYALGSILYYMITCRPPFAAPTPLETVRKLLQQEPVWPSKLQSDLDKDLETICLKALEKDVDKRYATAEEFADELQRFLDGKPIKARPITRRERLWKWCKRNPLVATLSGTALTLLTFLLLGGIISAVVINEQKKAEHLARKEAEDNAKLSHDTSRLVIYDTKEFFNKNPQLQPLRESLMTSIVERLEKHYAQQQRENPSEVFAASADRHLGQMYVETGRFDKAVEKLKAAEKKLVKLDAEGKIAKADISKMHITLALADAYFGLGDLKQAEKLYLDLLQQRKNYVVQEGDYDVIPLTRIYGKLGSFYRATGKPDLARRYIQKTVDIERERYERNPDDPGAIEGLSAALSELSEVYEKAGETEKMLDASLEAIALKERLPNQSTNTARQHNFARDQKILARQYLMIGKPEKALGLLDKAAATMDRLLESSDDGRMQALGREIHYYRGIALKAVGKDPTDAFAKAEKYQRALVAKSDTSRSQGELLKILARAGRVDEAIPLADELAKSPDNIWNCGYAACGYGLIAEHLDDDDPRKAELIEKAIDMTRKLIRHGYTDFDAMRSTDPDFAPLQQIPAYLQMLDEERARIESQKHDQQKSAA